MNKPSEQFEQAYDNFLAGCDVDTTMLDCAEFMFNAGRESAGQGEPVAVDHSGLIKRIDAAIERVTKGWGLMTIPADPRSDVDLVLGECKALLQGENPPFWATDFHPPQPVQPVEPVAHYGIIDPDYARVFTQARCIAWQYGYACVMQGSFTRDLDLLMVPWTEQAKDNREQMLKLIAMACELRFSDGKDDVIQSKADFTQQPHGRTSCSLHFPKFGDRRWIDVSFFPVQANPPAEAAPLVRLTDEDIEAALTEAVKSHKLPWLGYKPDADGEYTLPLLSRMHYGIAYAIMDAMDRANK